MSQETYRQMVMTNPKRTWTETQTVRALVLEYARWNWLYLAMAFCNVFFFLLMGSNVGNPGPWIGALGMLSMGVSMMMHDLTSRRRLGAVLGLGIPSRTLARAMWYEAVVVSPAIFLCASLLPALVWGVDPDENTIPHRLFANGINTLVGAAFCSTMVHAAARFGPPKSGKLAGVLTYNSGPILYMAATVVAVAGFGFLCYLNFDLIVRGETIRLPRPIIVLLMLGEGVACAALAISARTAAHRLLTRHVCARKPGAAAGKSVRKHAPLTRATRRPSYWERLCRETAKHVEGVVLPPVVGGLIVAVPFTMYFSNSADGHIHRYEGVDWELIVSYLGWLPLAGALLTLYHLSGLLSGLSALRMLPWGTRKLIAYLFAGPIATGIAVALTVFALRLTIGAPVQPGLLLLLTWVSVFGFLCYPHHGALVAAILFLMWGIYAGTGLSTGWSTLCGVASLAVLYGIYWRIKQIVVEGDLYRRREFTATWEEYN